jgi:hypothetical protein
MIGAVHAIEGITDLYTYYSGRFRSPILMRHAYANTFCLKCHGESAKYVAVRDHSIQRAALESGKRPVPARPTAPQPRCAELLQVDTFPADGCLYSKSFYRTEPVQRESCGSETNLFLMSQQPFWRTSETHCALWNRKDEPRGMSHCCTSSWWDPQGVIALDRRSNVSQCSIP